MIKRFDQINMIPFIDIMLVLMAIVMTTASFVEIGLIDVDLPIAQQSATPTPQQKYIEIGINVKNELFFKGEKITLENLDVLLSDQQNTTPVQLRVDKGAIFDAFIGVINQLKIHQFENISIETQSSPS